jgi:hypothetical protein
MARSKVLNVFVLVSSKNSACVETVRGCASFQKYKSQGKAVEMTVNSKEENSSDFCLDFFPEFGIQRINSIKGKTDTKIQFENKQTNRRLKIRNTIFNF